MDSLLIHIENIDRMVNQWASTIHTPLLDKIMFLATSAGEFLPMTILSILIFLLLILLKRRNFIAPYFVAIPGGFGLMNLLKYLFGRERPPDAAFHVTGYSFPSGHAMMSTIILLFILVAFTENIKKTLLRIIFFLLIAGAILLISFSRIYFNVHWLSDVIGGIVLGIIWLGVSLSLK